LVRTNFLKIQIKVEQLFCTEKPPSHQGW